MCLSFLCDDFAIFSIYWFVKFLPILKTCTHPRLVLSLDVVARNKQTKKNKNKLWLVKKPEKITFVLHLACFQKISIDLIPLWEAPHISENVTQQCFLRIVCCINFLRWWHLVTNLWHFSAVVAGCSKPFSRRKWSPGRSFDTSALLHQNSPDKRNARLRHHTAKL